MTPHGWNIFNPFPATGADGYISWPDVNLSSIKFVARDLIFAIKTEIPERISILESIAFVQRQGLHIQDDSSPGELLCQSGKSPTKFKCYSNFDRRHVREI